MIEKQRKLGCLFWLFSLGSRTMEDDRLIMRDPMLLEFDAKTKQ